MGKYLYRGDKMKLFFPWKHKKSPLAFSIWVEILRLIGKEYSINICKDGCQLLVKATDSNNLFPIREQMGK